MTNNTPTVECIGTCAVVTLWEVQALPNGNSQRLGQHSGSLLGNDAVIVARELRELGICATCCLLNATSADVALVRSRMPTGTVRAVGEIKGELTRSLCLEEANGQRSWVFSRRIKPHGQMHPIESSLVYLDCYPELAGFFNSAFEGLDLSRVEVFVNLSVVRDTSGLWPFAFTPTVVQASVAGDITAEESVNFAGRLLQQSGARMAFVTLGHRGATVAEGSEAWHSAAPFVVAKSTLGAGAVFSSTVIVGLLQKLSRRELLEFSVRQTAARLQSWKAHDEDFRT